MKDRDFQPPFHVLKATTHSGLVSTTYVVEVGRTDEDDPKRVEFLRALFERYAGGARCGRKRSKKKPG